MMMEPKCTVVWLIACWPHESQQSTVNSQNHESLMLKVMSHWCQSQTISQLDSRWFFNVVLNLSGLEICLILVGAAIVLIVRWISRYTYLNFVRTYYISYYNFIYANIRQDFKIKLLFCTFLSLFHEPFNLKKIIKLEGEGSI